MWPHGPAPGWWRMMILTPAPARQPLSYSVTIQSLISLAPYGMSMHDVPKNWPREALLPSVGNRAKCGRSLSVYAWVPKNWEHRAQPPGLRWLTLIGKAHYPHRQPSRKYRLGQPVKQIRVGVDVRAARVGL